MPLSPSTHGAIGGVLLLFLLTGCSSDPERLSPVRGTVYFQGTPLHNGSIVFTPDPARGGTGPLARAEIQPDGSYILRTDDKPGATAGWHRVTVLAVQPLDVGPGRRLPVPRKYSDPELSGLSFQVKPDQANTIDVYIE